MKRSGVIGLLPLFAVLSGCQILALFHNPNKTVKAEYPYLDGKKVCLVVRTDVETQQVYPQVQFELADFVRAELQGHIRNVVVVEPRKVVDFQRGDPGWEKMDPADLGQKFGADRVIEVDVTQYTTREPENEYLYRGHISAAVRVYWADHPNSKPSYQSQVQVAYPTTGARWGESEREIRENTMVLFAQEVAGKFYNRQVPEHYTPGT